MDFSLCIPTMKRWSFLKENLPKYLQNKYIKEIVIVDETGEDYALIQQFYPNEPKIKLFKNDVRLGVFLNKLECMKKASCDWICLIDSDNFADEKTYFDSFLQYVTNNPNKNTIYCPSFAAPNFDFSSIQNIEITQYSIKNLLNSNKKGTLEVCCNVCNFILHKNNVLLIQEILASNTEFNAISKSYFPCDSIFLNYLLLLQNRTLLIVPNMKYEHVVHAGSIYATTHMKFKDISERVHTLFRQLSALVDHTPNRQTHSLRVWQQIDKPVDKLIYNSSECTYLNDEWVPFPIGMSAQLINYKGNLTELFKGTHEKLVLCAISETTDQRRRPTGQNRKQILNTLSNNNIKNTVSNYTTYIESLKHYKFVISPEGNGIDCHRHYEALMAGCIPIVEDNPLIREKYSNFPILYTTDYSEITHEYLEQTYKAMINEIYDFCCLFIDNYSLEHQHEIQKNGNYWANRHFGKQWYHFV